MLRLWVHANDNTEWSHKTEFMRLGAIVWPEKKHYRWDKFPKNLENFLWFLKFETAFLEKAAQLKREEFKVIE